jgi:hypothetical protein
VPGGNFPLPKGKTPTFVQVPQERASNFTSRMSLPAIAANRLSFTFIDIEPSMAWKTRSPRLEGRKFLRS